jgi:DNA-binding protein YbaB
MDQFDPDQLIALSAGKADDLAQKLTEVQQKLHEVGNAMRDLQQRSIRGESADGLVSAEVTGMSKLIAVHISPKAMRDLDNRQLGESAREAIGAARANAAKQLMEAFSDVTGETPESRDSIKIPEDLAAAVRQMDQEK